MIDKNNVFKQTILQSGLPGLSRFNLSLGEWWSVAPSFSLALKVGFLYIIIMMIIMIIIHKLSYIVRWSSWLCNNHDDYHDYQHHPSNIITVAWNISYKWSSVLSSEYSVWLVIEKRPLLLINMADNSNRSHLSLCCPKTHKMTLKPDVLEPWPNKK